MKFLPSKEQFEIIKQGVEEIIPESALLKKLENSKELISDFASAIHQ